MRERSLRARLGRLVLATAAAGLMAPGAALGATINVDGNDGTADAGGCGTTGPAMNACNTIQAGVNNAAAGDRVQIAPFEESGPYTEAVTIDNTKTGLILAGPAAGVPAINRSSNPGSQNEAVVDTPDDETSGITISATDVVVDGIVVKNDGGGAGIALSGGTGQMVRNSIFRNNTIGVALGSDGATIEDSAFYINNNPGPANGNGIYSDSGVDDATIDSNFFDNNDNAGVLFAGGAQRNADTQVSNNDADGGGAGYFLSNLDDGVVDGNTSDSADGSALLIAGANGVDATDNSLTGTFNGVRFFGPDEGFGQNTGVNILGNTITDNANGVRGTNNTFAAGDGPEIHFNRIVRNTDGIVNQDTTSSTYDAENNFFGCNTGPGTAGCDDINSAAGAVDANPYLVLTASATPGTVTVPGASQIRGSLLTNSAGMQPVGAAAFPATSVGFVKTSGPGTLASPAATTSNGVASDALSSTQAGTSTVRASLDNATASATVTFQNPAPGGGGTNVINGTNGNDTINGTAGNDVINCGDGNDVVNGGGGDDVINCGAGNDRVNGNAGNDRIDGGSGNDLLSGNEGNDRVVGGSGNDRANGNEGNDRVGGQSGNDRVGGQSGNDRVNGDSGRDRVSGGSGNDRVSGGSGNDRVNGDSGRDRVSGGSGNDTVSGSSGNDRLAGDSGNDRVSGGSGNDRLSGGRGNDRLNGGRGRDRLNGGPGRDRETQ